MRKAFKIKVNNKISAFNLPAEIRATIADHLTIANPVWIDNHRMGRWNRDTARWLHMFKEKGQRIEMPLGYLDDLFDILNRNKLDFDLYDQRCERSARMKFTGELRDFQIAAVRDMSEHDRGTLEAPTGSGKTVMALYLAALRSQRTLIIVHTKELAYQWVERAEQFLDLKSFEIGMIGDGKEKIGDELTVGLVQSIYPRADRLSKEFGHIIVDECHRTPSRTFTEAVSAFRSLYLTGLSATPFRRDNLTKFIFWYIGSIRHSVNKKKLIDAGQILSPIFIMRETSFIPDHDAIAEYSQMLSELTQDEKRNDMICEDISAAVAGGDCCLVLSDRKAHCQYISDRLRERFKISSEVLTGDTTRDKRKEITCNIAPDNIRVICATGQLIGEGFDCKELNALFIATPIKFSGRVLQYIGRIMRPAKNKEKPIVYDYADWQIDVLGRAARSRIKLYGKDNVRHE